MKVIKQFNGDPFLEWEAFRGTVLHFDVVSVTQPPLAPTNCPHNRGTNLATTQTKPPYQCLSLLFLHHPT